MKSTKAKNTESAESTESPESRAKIAKDSVRDSTKDSARNTTNAKDSAMDSVNRPATDSTLSVIDSALDSASRAQNPQDSTRDSTASVPNSPKDSAPDSKLALFPITLFASVMGIGGLSLAFKKIAAVYSVDVANAAQSALAPVLLALGYVCATIASVVFLALLGFYIAKIIAHPAHFRAEIAHQVKINFLSAVPIGALILAIFWSDFKSVDSARIALFTAFYLASALQLILSLYVIAFWFRNAMKAHLLSPAWFIPIVGNLIVPLCAAQIGAPRDIMLFFFSIGCFFWVILSALIMQRLIFEASLEEKFLPTLFIFIAPPSIFVLDFSAIFGAHSDFSVMIYYLSLFFVLLLLGLSGIFMRIKFAVSWWAFTFPLCAFSLASGDLYIHYAHKGVCGYEILGSVGLIAALIAVIFVSYKTIFALKSRAIFAKE